MSNQEIVLRGIPAAGGIAGGSSFILDKQDFVVPPRAIMEKEITVEIARFEEALVKTKEEILGIKKKIQSDGQSQQAKIFDAHLLVLEDKVFIDEVIEKIKQEKLSAEYVFSEVLKKYIRTFLKIEDEYLRERASDINDVGRRVLKNLLDETKMHDFEALTEEIVIVAHDLSPSDTASMYNKNIIGFVTDIGGRTSHTAIMAKSLGVPAVIGLKDITLRIRNQDYVIVDGRKGLVIINPTEETKQQYKTAKARIVESQERHQEVRDLPAETIDKRKITLMANLELPAEIPTVLDYKAAGIGLYRTEYFYMNRVDLPSEEEQFQAYKLVAEKMATNPVTIRTLDLGGDKFISSLQIPKEMYPYLGWRALRFCLARPDIFKTQLRAILRASLYGNVRLMYPMVTGLNDLRQANSILNEAKDSLRKENIKFNEKIPVGIMVEVPSAAMIADVLAKEASFFSIGTNDLISYTLAVERVSEQAEDMYQPGHPAVLRLVKNTIEAAAKAKIEVSLCGEMAAEPAMAFILLGLGLQNFSMSPLSILQIKNLIRNVSFKDAQKLAKDVLELSTGQEVEELSKSRLKELAAHFVSDKGDS